MGRLCGLRLRGLFIDGCGCSLWSWFDEIHRESQLLTWNLVKSNRSGPKVRSGQPSKPKPPRLQTQTRLDPTHSRNADWTGPGSWRPLKVPLPHHHHQLVMLSTEYLAAHPRHGAFSCTHHV
ncbi:hypothetical protein VFPPC_17753 [Pochonia chlamydosporia 170]|uniref:Uncharacterized protein n=1 Tax=Pochonia chlamydosporia 170 TaxID=1380566 RepID=A0A219AQP6_METCM|nr:hypothetical protein VFPPC_17753 [Pochonia chlamydosporia 170]OWT43071.1 hypothetical protein VFPPC_17753 [Pochonia chlamydosporia 170]